ncbi:MAG: ABC transporter ATP-binding protein [Ruminococcus sp.]|nr:ABC transporter ATP-binding protein [Ruminococcus sp.]
MIIKLENVKKSFGNNVIFDDLSFEIKRGELVAIIGKSGSGKSTLLNILGGLERIDSGKITVDDLDITQKKNLVNYFRTEVGFVFQNFALTENKTVKENLEIIKKNAKSGITIEDALESVGLKDKLNEKIYKLSGGEQQRVSLARVMIKKCNVILADEPTGSLDPENGNKIMDIFKRLNKEGKTVIIVTHDMKIAEQCERVIKISDGNIV